LQEAEEKEKESLRLARKAPDLSTLVRRFTEVEGIEESALRSGMREKKVAKARKIFCQVAVGRMGYSGAEVARFLGVSTSSVNRLAVSEEEGALRKYLKMF
jgi:hypothetical protein